MATEVDDDDYYGLLGLSSEGDWSEGHIKKAYRKRALMYHPDKVALKDKEWAERMFHLVKKAFDILSDPKAKAAYDGVVRARMLRKQKTAEMSRKRKRQIDELHEREHEHKRRRLEEEDALRELQRETERVRKEAYERVSQRWTEQDYEEFGHLISVTWDSTKSRYEAQRLWRVFERYGMLDTIDMIGRESAIVSFAEARCAVEAMEAQVLGDRVNPLRPTWLAGKPPTVRNDDRGVSRSTGSTARPVPVAELSHAQERARQRAHEELEADVLARLTVAAERQRALRNGAM